MGTYVLRPISDAGPNDGSPIPGSPASHFDKVDDEPHDGGATALIMTGLGKEFFGWDASAIPGTDAIVSLTLRWTSIKGGGATYEGRVGLRRGGVEHYAAARPLPASYAVFDEAAFATADPLDGEAWTKARLQAAEPGFELTAFSAGIPRPDLNNLVGIVETVSDPPRPDASAVSRSATAAVSDPGKPTATASSVAPTATPSGLAPTSTLSVQPPKGDLS